MKLRLSFAIVCIFLTGVFPHPFSTIISAKMHEKNTLKILKRYLYWFSYFTCMKGTFLGAKFDWKKID